LEGEVWKDITIRDKCVKVSNYGRVLNEGYNGRKSYGATRKTNEDSSYKYYAGFKVHRLVMMAFEPREECENLVVDHINGIKDDNRLENLRWATHSENRKNCKSFDNSTRLRKKVSQYDLLTGIHIRDFDSITEAAKSCGVTDTAIGNCARGKTRSSGGYIWKYYEDKE
jgi:hypothetical protein